MNRTEKINNGIIWTVLGYVVTSLYGFISVPILINYFGKSNYGLIGLAMSVNVYLSLMDMGLTATSIRYFSNWIASGNEKSVSKLFQTNLAFYGVVGFINAIALFVLAFFAADIFAVTDEQCQILKTLLYILAINAFVSWYTSCFNQLIQGDEYVGWFQKISILPKLFQLVILWLTVFLHFSIELYYALTVFIIAIITVPLMVFKIRRICPYVTFVPRFDKNVFWEIFPYSISIFSINIFQFSATNLRPIFLGMQSPVDSVADFRIVYAISHVALMIGGTFFNVLLPTVSKATANSDKRVLDKITYQGTKFVTVSLSLCSFGLICIVPELLEIYVGKEFLYLVPWLDLYLLSNLGSHNQAIASIIFSRTDFKPVTYFTIISCLVSLLVCWLAIPYYQVGGVVISVLVYALFQLGFLYIYYWPVKMKINVRKILFSSFLPFAMSGFIVALVCRCFALPFSLWSSIFVKGIMFVTLYLLSVYLMFNNEDRGYIKSMILALKKK